MLGCLRDGKPRHGYDVCVELRARTGLQVNAGNVYRELAKLSSQGMIDAIENPRDADVRRNPYRITERGQGSFDDWLNSPTTHGEELSSWIAFLDRLPPDELPAILERLQERLWLQSKTLSRDREDHLMVLRSNADANGARYDFADVRLLFRLKQVTAVLEFVEELQRSLGSPPTREAETVRRPKR